MAETTWTISECDNRAHWLAKEYVPVDLRPQLAKTDILLLPQDGFRDFTGPLYPVGTEEFLRSLQDAGGDRISVDVTVSSEDYKELALHADWLILAGIAASMFAAPITVNMVSEYLKRRIWPEGPKRGVKVKLRLQDGEGEAARSVEIAYEGPADDFEHSMEAAFTELRGRGHSVPTLSEAIKQLEAPPALEVEVDADGTDGD